MITHVWFGLPTNTPYTLVRHSVSKIIIIYRYAKKLDLLRKFGFAYEEEKERGVTRKKEGVGA